jgi:hypothetical protein
LLAADASALAAKCLSGADLRYVDVEAFIIRTMKALNELEQLEE